jgi:hypothetical protein
MMKGTVTSMGFIPNLMLGKVELVAKLDITNPAAKVHDPIIYKGRVIYAMPGGGEFVGGRVDGVVK